LLNALEITVEQSPLALQMFLHGQADRTETWLNNGLFSPRNRPARGTTALLSLFPTHLHSFDGPIAMEEQRPSLETPTWQTNDRPKFSG
jgi:hypothetical protein